MSAEKELASAFLSQSKLQWTEAMAEKQIVLRDQLVDVLVAYRKAPAASIPQPVREAYRYFRLLYYVGSTPRSVWARQTATQAKPVGGVVTFEVCNASGEPLSAGKLGLRAHQFDATPAKLVSGTPNRLEIVE